MSHSEFHLGLVWKNIGIAALYAIFLGHIRTITSFIVSQCARRAYDAHIETERERERDTGKKRERDRNIVTEKVK